MNRTVALVALIGLLFLEASATLGEPRPALVIPPAAWQPIEVPEPTTKPTPTDPPPTPTPEPSPTPTPEPTPVPEIVTPKPVVVANPTQGVRGVASWYDWRPGEAAAGPALRVGKWRGRLVTVCAETCLQVRLTDWCGCPDGRVIDLDDQAFAAITATAKYPDGQLWLGLVVVRVTW